MAKEPDYSNMSSFAHVINPITRREVLGPASPPPVSSDVVKNMLNQIEAFSTAMRRTWGEP